MLGKKTLFGIGMTEVRDQARFDKGLRALTQIFFEQILIKTIGEVNGHPDYVACF